MSMWGMLEWGSIGARRRSHPLSCPLPMCCGWSWSFLGPVSGLAPCRFQWVAAWSTFGCRTSVLLNTAFPRSISVGGAYQVTRCAGGQFGLSVLWQVLTLQALAFRSILAHVPAGSKVPRLLMLFTLLVASARRLPVQFGCVHCVASVKLPWRPAGPLELAILFTLLDLTFTDHLTQLHWAKTTRIPCCVVWGP